MMNSEVAITSNERVGHHVTRRGKPGAPYWYGGTQPIMASARIRTVRCGEQQRSLIAGGVGEVFGSQSDFACH